MTILRAITENHITAAKFATQDNKVVKEDGAAAISPPKRLDYPLMAFLLDALSIGSVFTFLASKTALTINFISKPILDMALLIVGMTVIWLALFMSKSLYSLEHRAQFMSEIRKLISSSLLAFALSMGLLYLLGLQVSRTLLVYHLTFSVIAMVLWRVIVQTIRYINFAADTKLPRRILVVGTESRIQDILKVVQNIPQEYTQVVGVINGQTKSANANVLGRYDSDFKTLIAQHNIDDIVVGFSRSQDALASRILDKLNEQAVQTYIVPAYMSLSLFSQDAHRLDELLMVNVNTAKPKKLDLFLKRTFDILVALIAIIFAAPTMALVALAIKMESPGPVLFLQERIGTDGKKFTIFKFRSMRAGADKELDSVCETDDEGRITNHKRAGDPRVTRMGKIIRKTSLDELPQVFNVLRGDMSIVGPRPELSRIVNEYEPWQHRRFQVKQGITGWWQVNGRSDNPCHMSTHQDLEYINNYSFLLDMQIILMTIPALLKGKGAF